MTEASRRALEGLRDWSTMQWYAIPLLAIVIYIYAREMKDARRSGSWDAVLGGLIVFGMDFINESVNGWILVLSGRSALWTAPGPTALRTMVGWNIEIMFMFALAGIAFVHTLPEPPHRGAGEPPAPPLMRRKVAWLMAAAFSAFSVLVEWFLNVGGHLVWDYEMWNRSLAGIWLIFLFGYFHFYAAVILVLSLRTARARLTAIGAIYAVAVALNVIGQGVLGWTY